MLDRGYINVYLYFLRHQNVQVRKKALDVLKRFTEKKPVCDLTEVLFILITESLVGRDNSVCPYF